VSFGGQDERDSENHGCLIVARIHVGFLTTFTFYALYKVALTLTSCPFRALEVSGEPLIYLGDSTRYPWELAICLENS
jgi:hypothetical protein